MADLFFAELLFKPESGFGKFFSLIGEAPALLPAVYALVALIIYAVKRKTLKKENLKKGIIFFAYMVFVVISAALIVSLLKKCWGRVRYVDLGKNAEGFTPWYMPNGLTGGESFPSGHAAMSALIFFIPDCIKYFLNKSYKTINLLSFVFVVCVMLARMLLGAHYLSDLIAGAIIAYAARHAFAALFLNRFSSNSTKLKGIALTPNNV